MAAHHLLDRSRYERSPAVSRRRRMDELWGELLGFIQQRGASITSVANAWPARLECAPDAQVLTELPLATIRLDGKRFGFNVRAVPEDETGGPVLRNSPAGAIEIIPGEHSSAPPTRILQHVAL